MSSLAATGPVIRPEPVSARKADGMAWSVGVMTLVLVAQAVLIFTRAINWDEFFYYSQVHQFLRGEALPPFNTFHVHLFAWLPHVAANSVDAIVYARVAMFGAEMVTLGAIFAIGSRLTDRNSASIAMLAYVSAGFVLQHGFSFRVDPTVTACLMTALAILIVARLSPLAIVAFALMAGLAGMITIKAILYAPAFAGAAWWRWQQSGFDRRLLVRITACLTGGAVVCALLYLYHSQGLAGGAASGGAGAIEESGDGMLRAAGSSVFFIGIPPYVQMMQKAVFTAPLLALLIAITPFAIWRDATSSNAHKLLYLGFWLPLLTLAFYRNTAPYYYAFMLAPVVIGVLPAIAVLRRHASLPILAIGFALPAAALLAKEDTSVIANQRTVAAVASQMFDAPVDYFDHNGMLAEHRKANGFMTPWGLEGYGVRGKSMFRPIMERQTVPLLLENDQLLVDLLNGTSTVESLSPEDSRVLRANYVRAWGPVWLAGRDIAPGSHAGGEWLVPGEYRVEGSPVTVDGQAIAAGGTVTLARGDHTVANPSRHPARLIWADVDRMPSQAAPDGRLWIGF